jgi:enamine deaminase RidA (YjgF/YER057c/UK114 family)
MIIENRLKDMGIDLPLTRPSNNDNRVSAVRTGNLVFLSGAIARKPDGTRITGKVGKDVTQEEAYESAKWTAVNLLDFLKEEIGDLDSVTRIIKLTCYINAADGFFSNAAVANGASDFLVELYGERGQHSRTAIGVVAPAGNSAVQCEMVVEVK